jgi:predicted MPP superfamily phosphohydrolase
MSLTKINRRRFILAGLLLTPWAVVADARWIEPQWVKIRRLQLAGDTPTARFVHFSDLHHKGDRAHTQSVVDMINALSPDFVCFTGDLIEEAKFLPEALEILAGIKSPLYGVPGNHDYGSRAPFSKYAACFAATGGAWLVNEQQVTAGGKVNIIGVGRLGHRPLPETQPGMKNLLLMHFPAWAKGFGDRKFDLLLAGHSHGCQVRIPFYGPVMVPYGVDEYDLGLFQTQAGPLNVTSGIGWYPIPVRFNCRPEITLVEI